MGVGIPPHHVVAFGSRSTDDDINLLFDWASGAWRRYSWLFEVAPKMSSSDQLLDLVLEVSIVLCIMTIVSMKPIIFRPIFVSSFQWVGFPKESLLHNLEKDFSARSIQGQRRGSLE